MKKTNWFVQLIILNRFLTIDFLFFLTETSMSAWGSSYALSTAAIWTSIAFILVSASNNSSRVPIFRASSSEIYSSFNNLNRVRKILSACEKCFANSGTTILPTKTVLGHNKTAKTEIIIATQLGLANPLLHAGGPFVRK